MTMSVRPEVVVWELSFFPLARSRCALCRKSSWASYSGVGWVCLVVVSFRPVGLVFAEVVRFFLFESRVLCPCWG